VSALAQQFIRADSFAVRLDCGVKRHKTHQGDVVIYAMQFVAALSTCLFAGAAIYINLVEHPARMGCETRIVLTVWAPSYKKATLMQGALAMIGFLSGLVVWLLGVAVWWVVGALFIGAVVPFTFIVIMPTNHQLLAPGRDLSSAETRNLLEKWGNLHGVRSALSFVASVINAALLVGA
jgi:uncharacterized membrane protein